VATPPNRRWSRRRKLRLLRTVGVALALLVVILVARSRGGRRNPRSVTSPPPSTATSSAVAAPATTTTAAAAPTTLTVAALPDPLPQPVSRAVVLVEGSRLLVLGGLHGRTPGVSTTQVLSVDPTSGAAVAEPSLAVATHDAAGAVLGDVAHVFGGGGATTVDVVQTATSSGSRIVSHLPQPRSDVESASADGRAYVIGGFDGTKPTPDVLVTADGVTFHVAATLPVAVRYPAVAVVGSMIYVIGGQSVTGPTGSGPAVTDIQAVDMAVGSATVVARLPAALTEAAGFAVGGTVFVAGGVRNGVTQAGVYRLDPATGALTLVANLPSPRADAGVAQIGDATFLVGGEGPARLASIVELRPA
jgi:hypothetical protein